MMSPKSQVSLEFMTFVAILFILLTIIVSNSFSFAANTINARVYAEGKKMSDSIAFEINTAAKAGDGYQRKFLIGNDVFGITDFVIAANSYTVTVDWRSGFASTPIVVADVQGNFSKGWNVISNSGGAIYVA